MSSHNDNGILGVLTGRTHGTVTVRDIGRGADDLGRTAGAILGIQGTIDENHYRRTSRGDDAHLRALRSHDRLEGYRNGDGPQQPYGSYGPQQPYGRAPAGRVPGYGYGSGPMGGEGLESQFVTQLMLANQHPENGQYVQNARAIAQQMTGPDGLIHMSGSVRKNIDGQSVNINFGSRQNDTAYSSFEAAEADVAKRAQLTALHVLQATGRASGAGTEQRLAQQGELQRPGVIPTAYEQRQPDAAPTQAAPQAAPHAAPAAAPSTATPTTAAPTTETPAPKTETPAAETPTAAPQVDQKKLNQEAQLYLERMGMDTGNRNHRVGTTMAADADRSADMDGIVGPRTTAALEAVKAQGVAIKDIQHITPEEVAALKAKSAEYMQSRVAQHVAEAPAPAPATPQGHEAGHAQPAPATVQATPAIVTPQTVQPKVEQAVVTPETVIPKPEAAIVRQAPQPSGLFGTGGFGNSEVYVAPREDFSRTNNVSLASLGVSGGQHVTEQGAAAAVGAKPQVLAQGAVRT